MLLISLSMLLSTMMQDKYLVLHEGACSFSQFQALHLGTVISKWTIIDKPQTISTAG